MRAVTAAEVEWIVGGLKRPNTAYQGQRKADIPQNVHPDLLPPPGGGPGDGYSGFLGELWGIGSFDDYSFASFELDDANVTVHTGDQLKVENDHKCKLETPSGLQIAEGVLTILGSALAVTAGAAATLGSAGLFSIPGGGAIAVGLAGIGVGAVELAPTCKKQ